MEQKRVEKKQILKRRGQSGSRGGCLYNEGMGTGTLLHTKADLPQLVHEKIYSKFCFQIHSSFLGRTQKNS